MSAGLLDAREATARESRHGPVAQLLIAWSPLSAVLAAYWLVQWVTAPLGEGDGAATNRLGFGLHVLGPARADEAVFGTVPSVWLQERLVGDAPQWWDAVAALVYVTHFLVIPVMTAVVWFRVRQRFAAWLASVLTMCLVGFAGYVVYPAAPPWLASRGGEIGAVDRISSWGWDLLHLGPVGVLTSLGQDGSNPVAAMPSLHAGAALLVALSTWSVLGVLGRTVGLAYALAMAAVLVYTGEHYVVDVVAGWLAAGVGIVVGSRLLRPDPRAVHEPADTRVTANP